MSTATLLTRVDEALRKRRLAVSTRTMMGVHAYMVNDKLCLGVMKGGRLLVRIAPEEREAVLAGGDCAPLKMGRRTMNGYVTVARKALASDAALEAWIQRALAFNPRAVRSRR